MYLGVVGSFMCIYYPNLNIFQLILKLKLHTNMFKKNLFINNPFESCGKDADFLFPYTFYFKNSLLEYLNFVFYAVESILPYDASRQSNSYKMDQVTSICITFRAINTNIHKTKIYHGIQAPMAV